MLASETPTRTHLLACGTFLALALALTYPLAVQAPTSVYREDPLHLAWILAWDCHAIQSSSRLLEGNTFYPATNALVTSEALLGDLPFFAPTYALTGNPLLALNLMTIVSFWLSGFFIYLFLQRITGTPLVSFLGGLLFAFSPWRFGHLGHPSLLMVQWIPLALLFLDRFLGELRWRDAALCALFAAWQILCNFYLGYFCLIVLGLYAVFHPRARILLSPRAIFRLGSAGFLAALPILPLVLGYLQASETYGYRYLLSDIVGGSAQLRDFLVAPPDSRLLAELTRALRSPLETMEKFLFLSVVGVAGAVAGLFLWRRLGSPREKQLLRFGYGLVTTGFVLSLGPYPIVNGHPLQWCPLPYAWLHYLAPGFSSSRAPARFVFLMTIGLSLVVPVVAQHLTRGLSPKLRRVCLAFLSLAFVGETFSVPLHLQKIDDQSPIYSELRKWPGPMLELPSTGFLEQGFDSNQVNFTFWSTQHWHPIASGYCAFAPTSFHGVMRRAIEFPSPGSLTFLSDIGIRQVLVHFNLYPPGRVESLRAELLANPRLRLEKDWGSAALFSLPLSNKRWRVEVALAPRLPRDMDIRPSVQLEPAGDGATLSRSAQVFFVFQSEDTGRIYRSGVVLNLAEIMANDGFNYAHLSPNLPTGRYSYRVESPLPGVEGVGKAEVVSRLPDSRTRSVGLRADCRVVTAPDQVVAGQYFYLPVSCQNIGEAIWLGKRKIIRGMVGLDSQWLSSSNQLVAEERSYLPVPVLPTQTFAFNLRLQAPRQPGQYHIRLALVSEDIAWFADIPTPKAFVPLSVPIDVREALP
jgi:hypothetical protein